eukprot:768537-Hanusia_phi.AAC.4
MACVDSSHATRLKRQQLVKSRPHDLLTLFPLVTRYPESECIWPARVGSEIRHDCSVGRGGEGNGASRRDASVLSDGSEGKERLDDGGDRCKQEELCRKSVAASSSLLALVKSHQAPQKDPWALPEDLSTEEEKRKSAQRALEVAESAHKGLQQHERKVVVKYSRPPHRSLVNDQVNAAHTSLHDTRSKFVLPVDSTNVAKFIAESKTPFNSFLISENKETPEWYKTFASENCGVCTFGEIRCTDDNLMKNFAIAMTDPLPIVVVMTGYAEAIRVWRSYSFSLFMYKPGEEMESFFAYKSPALSPEGLMGCLDKAIRFDVKLIDGHSARLSTRSKDERGGKWY